MIDNVDDRLLEHWRRVRAARELAHAARRASWRVDPDAKMHEVRDTHTSDAAREPFVSPHRDQ